MESYFFSSFLKFTDIVVVVVRITNVFIPYNIPVHKGVQGEVSLCVQQVWPMSCPGTVTSAPQCTQVCFPLPGPALHCWGHTLKVLKSLIHPSIHPSFLPSIHSSLHVSIHLSIHSSIHPGVKCLLGHSVNEHVLLGAGLRGPPDAHQLTAEKRPMLSKQLKVKAESCRNRNNSTQQTEQARISKEVESKVEILP